MTNVEFARIATIIGIACRKPLTEDELVVYYRYLGDLPADVLQLAADRVLLDRVYTNFPSVGELRHAAASIARGNVVELTAAEAWKIGWQIIAATDPEIEGDFARASTNAPKLVVETIQSLGLCALCYGKEPVAVVRAQFIKAFEQLKERDEQRALLPTATRQDIEQRGLTRHGWVEKGHTERLRLAAGIGEDPNAA
jgi:hypothetical protein